MTTDPAVATDPGAPPLAQPMPLQPGQALAPGQQIVYQPVVVPAGQVPAQAAAPRAVAPDAAAQPPAEEAPLVTNEVVIYSHSSLFYWWPVWAVGYLLALITWLGGQSDAVGATSVVIHPSKNLGVIFTLTFFMVILITDITLRGMASLVAILLAIVATLLLAYFDLWDGFLSLFGSLQIYMNLGFYVFFSTAVFALWAFTFFVYDRLTYWRVNRGQITHETVIGGAERSFDTRGMVFEKHREDLFRHWILGIGSGDIQIATTGARRETIEVPNVLFVNFKLQQIQRLIAIQPDSPG